MTGYRLAPVIPTEPQRQASAHVPFSIDGRNPRPLWIAVADGGLDQSAIDCAYTAMVAAAPNALPDADRDGLCRLMWGDRQHWHPIFDDAIDRRSEELRNSDRIRMGIFLLNLASFAEVLSTNSPKVSTPETSHEPGRP